MPNLLNSFGRTKALVDNSGYTILNLSGAQKFDDNTVFNGGVYSIDVLAGSTFAGTAMDVPNSSSYGKGVGGKVSVEVIIPEPFIIRAYCGSKGNYGIGGTNPYSGAFKKNAQYQESTPVAVTHIFGNVGGSAKNTNSVQFPGGGNCLGNGVGISNVNNEKFGVGAGSCLHFLPIGGTFGTDYLFAAHCTAGPACSANAPFVAPGCGSAYGGSGAGYGAISSGGSHGSAWDGGRTPYGEGGVAVISSVPANFAPANGTGIGAGVSQSNGIGISRALRGAAAYFDGEEWLTSNLYGNTEEDGHIIVTLVRPLY